MEALKKRLYLIGETIHLILPSLDNPYKYLKMCGVIKTYRILPQGLTIYYIKLKEIQETNDDIHTYINSNRFRVMKTDSGITFNKRFFTNHMLNPYKNFIKEYHEYLFEVPSTLIFENKDEQITHLNRANDILLEYLNKNINMLCQK